MKIRDLENIANGKFELVHKRIGRELVELGFFRYANLNSTNYNYWWYEVKEGEEINKKAFTYKWGDLKETWKMEWLRRYIIFHYDHENGYGLLNNLLNIFSALGDGRCQNTGVLEWERVANFYYENRRKNVKKQLKIFA